MIGRPRRTCLLYQVDFDDKDILDYACVNKTGRLEGSCHTTEEFYDAVGEILKFFKTDRIEVALKFFRLRGARSTGICPKSFPRTQLTTRLLGILNLCLGGSSGTELVHMPFDGTLFDQPNYFIEAYNIYQDEHSKWFRTRRKRNEEKDRNQ